MAAFWRGVESGACALAVSALLRWLFQAPFLPELVAQRLFGLVPMSVFEIFVRTLGSWSKWAAFAGVVILTLGASGAAGRLLAPATSKGSPLIHAAWISVTYTAVGALVILPLLGFAPTGADLFPRPRFPAAIGIFLPSAAYGAWFFWGARPKRAFIGRMRSS